MTVIEHPNTTRSDLRPAYYIENDAPGDLRFARIGDLPLESGEVLSDVVVAYETWGSLNANASNAVLVEHALTGDSHVIGAAGGAHPTPGWWEGLVGPGAAVDTREFFVVAANVIGGCQGSTGPSTLRRDGTRWGSAFPAVTIRDQVAAEARLAQALGINRWHTVLGGSMGGMRVLEWAVTYPDAVASAIAIATTGYATADQIAWCRPQILAITSDPGFSGGDYYGDGPGPVAGLGIARSIAHTTYRTDAELDARFGRDLQSDDVPSARGRQRFAVESYLDHHGAKLARRFDANSYLVLSESMNSHDLGRDRGGLQQALSRFTGNLTAIAISTDRLFPPRLTHELAALRPGTSTAVVESVYGHDGFLLESAQLDPIVRRVLRTQPSPNIAARV